MLFQPSTTASFHVSYGTSFNTSADTYQFVTPQNANTPPEKSRNIEAGAKLELFDGAFSLRTSFFHSTKYNERNRDSPNNTPLTTGEYLLSGKRHAVGIDIDFAGRITPHIHARYPLDHWRAAFDALAASTHLGKIILEP